MHICHIAVDHRANDPRIYVRMVLPLIQEGFAVTLVARQSPITPVTTLKVNYIDYKPGLQGKLKMLAQARRLALNSRANIFHIHDPELLFLIPLLKQHGSVIYDVHENYTKSIVENRQGGRFSSLLAQGFSRFEKIIAKQCRAVVGATPEITALFAHHPHAVTICNYPPTATWVADLNDNQKQYDLAYVGGLAEERGLLDILDALTMLPDVSLALAGWFIDAKTEQAARNHPAWAQVCYCGQLDSSDVMCLLRQARIGLLPLWPQPRFLESLPLKLFEYMMAGIPVIASDFPYWRQIIGQNHCGVMIEPRKPVALAAAIRHLLAHPEDVEEMGKNGQRAVVEQYSWEAEFRKLLAIYKEVQPV